MPATTACVRSRVRARASSSTMCVRARVFRPTETGSSAESVGATPAPRYKRQSISGPVIILR